jgi:hypothetical protein
MPAGVATLTQSLSQRERAMNALPLWGRDRERECYGEERDEEQAAEGRTYGTAGSIKW